MKLTNAQKACRVIEALVSDDFSNDLGFKLAMNRKVELNSDDTDLIKKKISMIYRFAHIANEPMCLSVHDNWIRELNDVYVKFRRHGLVHANKNRFDSSA